MSETRPPFTATSAAEALDQIRAGGGHLLLVVNRLLSDVQARLNEGKFTDAHEAGQLLTGKLHQLAQAQNGLGLLAENRLVRVGELEVGMVMPGIGPITDVGPCKGCGGVRCTHVWFVIGDDQMVMDREVEVIVQAQ